MACMIEAPSTQLRNRRRVPRAALAVGIILYVVGRVPRRRSAGRSEPRGMGTRGWWRRVGVLLVLALVVSELVALTDASATKRSKKAKKKSKQVDKNKLQKASKNQSGELAHIPEGVVDSEELDHLGRLEREIGWQLSKVERHASSTLPKPTPGVVPQQEALMAAVLQAKLERIGIPLIGTVGSTAEAPGTHKSGVAHSDGIRGGGLMVLADGKWHPVAVGLVGNWTRHGFRCHGHAQQEAQEPNESWATEDDVNNATLAECQTACQKLRWCHYYSYRAADAADTAGGSRGRGTCEIYSAHPTPVSQVDGGRSSAAKAPEEHPYQPTNRAMSSDDGQYSSAAELDLVTQVDRCAVDLSGCSHPDAPDSTCLYTAGESTVDQHVVAAQLFGGQQTERTVKPNPAEELALAAPLTHKERLAATLAHFGKPLQAAHEY